MKFSDSQTANPYFQFGQIVAEAPVAARTRFIKKTYSHLAAAVYAFVAIEYLFFTAGFDEALVGFLQGGQFSMIIFFGGFMVVSMMANRMARSDASVGMQYAGLSLYVLFEAIFFLPLLSMAQGMAVNLEVIGAGDVGVTTVAAFATLLIFGGLTAFVLISKKDFSFMGSALSILGMGIFVLIIISMFAQFHLGVLFSVAMVVFASAYILYETSNVLHQYRTEQHVAASLALFASLAMLFYYILRIVMSFSNRN